MNSAYTQAPLEKEMLELQAQMRSQHTRAAKLKYFKPLMIKILKYRGNYNDPQVLEWINNVEKRKIEMHLK